MRLLYRKRFISTAMFFVSGYVFFVSVVSIIVTGFVNHYHLLPPYSIVSPLFISVVSTHSFLVSDVILFASACLLGAGRLRVKLLREKTVLDALAEV